MTNQTRRRRIRVPLMGTTPFSAEEVALTPFALANRGASAEELEAARRPPTPFSGSIANVGRFLTTGSTEAFQPTTPAGRLGPVGEFATGMVERFPQAFRGAYGKDEPQDREVRALIAEQERRGRALTPQEVGNVLRSVQRPTTTAREIGRAFTAPRSLEDIERTMAGEHGRLAQVLEPLNAIPPVAGALDPIEFVLRAQAARQTAQAVARTGAQAGREAVRQAPSVIGEGVQRFGADVLGQEPPAPVALPSRAAPRRKAQAAPPAATAAQAPTPPPAAAPAVAQPSPPPQPFQEYQGGQIAPATGRQVQGTPGAAPLLQPFAPPSLLPVPAQPTAITTPPPAAVTSAAAQPPPPAALLGGGGQPPSGTPPTVPPAAAGQAAPPPGNVPPVPPASTLNAPTPPPTGRGFALEPFPDPGARLLGQDTALAQRIRNTFGAKQVVGLVKRADMERDNAAAVLSFQRNIYRESQASRAHAAVLEWLNEAKETLGFDSRGIARKVQPANPGISGKLTGTIYDLVEYPERYILTPQQDNTIRRAQAIMESVLRSEQQAGITIGEVQNYWPRQVIGGPKSKTLQQLLQQLLQPAGKGASTGHTRGRIFPFAEDTVNEGYKINIDPGQTLYRRLEAGIDALANREALNRLSTLPGARGGFDPTFYERLVRVGTILPEEVAGQVYKWLGDVPGLPGFVSGRSISSEMFQLWRNIMVVFDLGATFLQGQALLYRNPVAWWRAQAAGVQAIVAQPVRYVAKNIDVIDEGIRMGAIRPPSEFLLQ
ncbi:MAG: hypothetical protein FJ315_03515, partial [SAR202 cluster bacterium]|nr:hypothetical protein [SAR202 cluster bacterium]